MSEFERPIKGYENNYTINNCGQVFSLPSKTKKEKKPLKATRFNNGYLYVDLCKGGKRKKFAVHRLVAEAFISNSESKEQVNHKNGDKLDNRASNLEWATRSENQLHAVRTGLRSAKGVKNSQAKLTRFEVKMIRSLFKKRGWKQKDLANEYGVSISTVSEICNNKTWSHL